MLLFQTSREIIFYFQHFIQVCFYFLGKKNWGARASHPLPLPCYSTDINGYLCVSFALSIQICFCLKLARCIERLSGFAEKYKSIPTLGYTHFQ